MMMTQTPATHPPLTLGLARLVVAVVAALVIAGAIMAGVLAMIDDALAWRGFAAGTLASVVAGIASILPLWIGSRFGLMGVVGGFFAASFVRAGVAIGGCLAAVWIWEYPQVSTLLSMGVYYLAVLTAESIVVGRLLWNQPAK